MTDLLIACIIVLFVFLNKPRPPHINNNDLCISYKPVTELYINLAECQQRVV